jgi:hypothetical protein
MFVGNYYKCKSAWCAAKLSTTRFVGSRKSGKFPSTRLIAQVKFVGEIENAPEGILRLPAEMRKTPSYPACPILQDLGM